MCKKIKPEDLKSAITEVLRLRAAEKEIQEQKTKAEETLSTIVHTLSPDDPTIEYEGYRVTVAQGFTYSLSDEGQKLLESKYGYDTAYWKKTINMSVVRDDKTMAEYVEAKPQKDRITIKEMKEEDPKKK